MFGLCSTLGISYGACNGIICKLCIFGKIGLKSTQVPFELIKGAVLISRRN